MWFVSVSKIHSQLGWLLVSCLLNIFDEISYVVLVSYGLCQVSLSYKVSKLMYHITGFTCKVLFCANYVRYDVVWLKILILQLLNKVYTSLWLQGAWFLKIVSVQMSVYVTGPAKIGHICTQNLASFLNFNLQYLLKYKYYDNEICMSYSPTVPL